MNNTFSPCNCNHNNYAETLQVGLQSVNYTVDETIRNLTVCVQLENDAVTQEGRSVTVSVRTRDGSARGNRDYFSTSSEWSFGHQQQRERCITIRIFQDSLFEDTEEFFVDLSTTSVGVELTTATASVFIINRDSTLVFIE